TTTSSLVFRDQASSTNGATAQDATLTFDANAANAGGTESITGFANFLGINDFFVDELPDNIHDSDVLSGSYTLGADTTLTFFNKTSGVAGVGMGSVNLTAGQTLDQMVTAINNASIGVTATKVPDGAGFKIRLAENNGNSMVVSSSTTFLSDVGMSVSAVRTSDQIKVRDDIVTSPARISRGALQWDSTKGANGEYVMSAGDDTSVQALARTLTSANEFSEAEGLAALTVPFASFSTSIISYNSALANTNSAEMDYQQSLTDSLQAKSDNFRGVNLDEEMTNLMLFEQAYGAAARVISTVQKMFDALENVI
ncbi:MAG: hypothetical protein HUJ11_02900, partial [Arenibacter algicola]|nr:hypothetical protein [Arenibacter algicola]